MGKIILNNEDTINISDDSTEYIINIKADHFNDIKNISDLFSLKNLKSYKMTFDNTTFFYYTYKKIGNISFTKLDNNTYSVTISLVDAAFSEIQTLEAEEYNQINKSTILAAQIIAQEFSDVQALLVKDIYPVWSKNQLYNEEYKVISGGQLYKCVKGHTSSDDITIENKDYWRALT
ncbi:hypothetical protein [Faecalicatena contorta]|uniref:Uncharacterized protein n=1 Tax=Faecalicatena contorta TaxID=39482 RepID=A0A316A0Q4_9FIRM|nr:hypothetical protein [Faecalicatena contorta]PWJ51119.1 hypothetical protein A8805_103420 [Faecalicatena contorta]SUQ13687.1 hypothetical protein SAMN05216529_103420 [Faecalicatena contorta]